MVLNIGVNQSSSPNGGFLIIKIGYQGDVGIDSEAAAENSMNELKSNKDCCELLLLFLLQMFSST